MGYNPTDIGTALVRLAQANADLEIARKENAAQRDQLREQNRVILNMVRKLEPPKPALRIKQMRGRIFDSPRRRSPTRE